MLDAAGRVDKSTERKAVLSEMVANHDAVWEAAVEAGRDIDEGHLVVVDLALEEDLAAEAPFDLAARMGSKVVVAFVDSAFQLDDCRPSCSQVLVAAVLDQEVDFGRDHPTVDLEAPQSYQLADMLADARPAEGVHPLDWAYRWLADL